MQAFKAGKVGIVVYPPKGMEREKAPSMLETYLDGLLLGYPNGIGIIHQPEENPQKEEDKYFHLHFDVLTHETQGGAKWIEEIVALIHCEPLQVSVEPIKNEIGALRYLIHADDPQKAQYKQNDVRTRSKDTLISFRKALEAKPNVTLERLLACENKRQIFELYGLKDYQKAVRAWEDIRAEDQSKAILDVRLAEFVGKVEKVYSFLSEATADKRWILKGSIPLKEYQELLRFCLSALEDIHSIYKYQIASDD